MKCKNGCISVKGLHSCKEMKCREGDYKNKPHGLIDE